MIRPSVDRSRLGRLLPLALAALPLPAMAGEWEAEGQVAAELRTFFEEPAFESQLESWQPSVVLTGEAAWYSDDGRHQVVAVPFLRLDGQDDERTHGDMREAYYRYAGNEVDLLIGLGRVFWGVTESRHLVDIVNQTDAVEDLDEEDKLGQPMVKLSFLPSWGKIDLFLLPYFRERTFPGVDGRLRFDPVIDTDAPIYLEDAGRWTPDAAVRYAHYIGDVDFGVSLFSGISREPRFAIDVATADAPRLRPIYERINQLGLDVQWTKGAWLYKFEGLLRETESDEFAAAVAGFEYTFFDVRRSGLDVGLLAEYQYDGRDEILAPPTAADDDLFLGTRIAFNDTADTALLAGAVRDLGNGSSGALIEGSTRLGNNWTAEIEGRFFFDVDDQDLLQAFREDSFLNFRVTRYF